MSTSTLRANVVLIASLILAVIPSYEALAQQAAAETPSLTPAQVRERLIAGGLPAPLADYFSAVQVAIVNPDLRAFAYRETYPDGSTRDVSYEIKDAEYRLSAAERAEARALGVNVYRTRVLRTPPENGASSIDLSYFVPYDEMSLEMRELSQPAAVFNWGGLLGIQNAVAQSTAASGVQVNVMVKQTLQEFGEQGFALLAEVFDTGVGAGLAAALSGGLDTKDALKLKDETEAYLRELDELERCARNPPEGVPVPEDERLRRIETIRAIRAELKEVTLVRFLNIVADYPLSALQRAGGAGGLVLGAALSVALKPFASWSDQTLKNYIDETLMYEARTAVPCKPCKAPASVTGPPAVPTAGGAPRRPPQSAPSSAPSNAPNAPAQIAACDPNRVTIHFTDRSKFRDLGQTGFSWHRVTFSSSALVERVAEGSTVLDGTSTGTFREDAESVLYGWCARRIQSVATATMKARVREEINEVQVTISGDGLYPEETGYERDPQTPQCARGDPHTHGGPAFSVSCTFLNVDVANGGFYKDQNYYKYADEDDDRLYDCSLRLGGPPEDEPPPEDDPTPDSPGRNAPMPSAGAGGGSSAPPPPPGAAARPGPSGSNAGVSPQSPPGPARYRALLTGVRTNAATVDLPTNADGPGDEIFGAVASFTWDRTARTVAGFRFARTREYGATGTANTSPQRVRAGGAGPTGGVAAGDVVPAGQDPATATAGAAATSDQFPLLLWEGTLTVGKEALVIAPSLWERDTQARTFDTYRIGWLTASLPAVMTQPPIAAALLSPALVVARAPDPPAGAANAAGRHIAVPAQALAADASLDRPVGLGALTDTGASYAERYVIVTREKVGLLPVGGATTVAVPLTDADRDRLGGDYELYVRIERIE